MIIGPVVEVNLEEVVKSLKRIERERQRELKKNYRNYYALHKDEYRERARIHRLNLKSYREKFANVYDNLII